MDWSGLINSVKDFFNFLPQIVYFIIGCCLQGIDACQFLFRKIIGLDTYYYDGTVAVNPINFGDDSSGDLIMQIFKNVFLDENFSVLKIAFISMIILGSILLIITTIAAMIRVEYRPDEKAGNSKGKIIGNTIKALGAFFAVPIICYFGIVLGNIALWGIEQVSSPATTSLSTVGAEITSKLEPSVTVVQEKNSGTTTRVVSYDFYSFFGEKSSSRFTPMSSVAMRLSLRSANRARIDDTFYVAVTGGGDTEETTLSFDIFNAYAGRQNEKELTANAIDSVFMLNAKLKTPQTINEDYKPKGAAFSASGTIEYFDRYDVGLVSYYYDLWYYMWPVALLFIMLVGKTLMAILFGLIKRIYMVFALLLLSPIPISMWPLDNGSALGDWRKKFTSVVFSAYGAVLSMNFFYLIYPVIYSFSFFGPSTTLFSVLDMIFQFLFVIAGILAIKDLDLIIAKFFDKESKGLIGEGEAVSKTFEDTSKKVVGSAMKAGKITAGVALGAGKMALGAGKMAYGVGRAGVNFAEMRHRENSLNKNERIGSVSDKDLENGVRKDVLGSKEFSDARDFETDVAMGVKLKNYGEMGGKLNRERIATLSGDAKADWDKMSLDEKKAFMEDGKKYNEKSAKMAYMHDRHALEAALNGATALEYNRNIKKRFGRDFMNDKTGTWRNTTTYAGAKEAERIRQESALMKEVDETLEKGTSTGKLGDLTLSKKNEAVEERQRAKEEAEKQKRKLNKMETTGSMLKRYSFGGVRDIGSGLGTIYRTVTPPKK